MDPKDIQAAVFKTLHRRDLVGDSAQIGLATTRSLEEMTEELAMFLVEKSPDLDGEELTLP
jgi:hypothetical protein